MLTRHGWMEWGGGALAAVAVIAGSAMLYDHFKSPLLWIPAGFAALLWVCVALFFRDPPRRIPEDPDILVSPADGVVRDVIRASLPELDARAGGREIVRVGIFLSVLDVHLNRAPCDMEVEEVSRRKGAFYDARDPRASTDNESCALICRSKTRKSPGMPMAVRQITGAIARRIVCPQLPGASLSKGERYGMIKFGSRTELFLPADAVEILVKPGDRVRGGTTLVARLK